MSSRIPCHLMVGSSLFLAAVSLPADAGERSREARLVPPAGASAPEARGQVSIGPEDLALTAEGLEPGEYPVLYEDGTGARTTLGVLSMGDDRDGSTGGKPWGKLELDASALQLAGRPLWVAREDGTVVLAGRAPLPITDERRAARYAILRTDAAPDPDAEGVLKLESGGGRVALKVHLKRLLPRTSYRVVLLDPAGGAAESLGLVTTDPDGKGQLKLDSSHGDPIPFGAGDLTALVGLGIEVRESDGRLVLAGAVSEPAVLDIETDDDDREVKGCTRALEVPDAAPIADAEGETVIETAQDAGAELEVEIVIDIPGAAYEVTLTDPLPSGATVSLGTAVMDCRGEGEVEVKDAGASAVPFGKSSVLELGGFLVSVRDESGALVLHGVVPDLDCPDGKGAGVVEEDKEDDEGEEDDEDDDGDDEVIIIEGCSAGAVPGNLIDGPPFAMIGEHDALFHRGDVNEDLRVSISDPVAALLYLLVGGARPRCLDAADFNDDGSLDLTDPILELRHLFLGDGMARSPGTLIKGSDPTPDGLYCEE